jgi:ankyrin repeat protein
MEYDAKFQRDFDDWTPLHELAATGVSSSDSLAWKIQTMTTILFDQASADPKLCTKIEKRNALMIAVEYKTTAIISLLVKEAPESLLQEDLNHFTPLYLATSFDRAECVSSILLAAKEHDDRKNDSKKQALPSLFSFLSSLFSSKAESNSEQTIQSALLERILHYQHFDDEWNCLHIASYLGHTDCCKLLLFAGANINAKEAVHLAIDANGSTPLNMAIMMGHVDTAKFLLSVTDADIDVNCATIDGNTPLHQCALLFDSTNVDLTIQEDEVFELAVVLLQEGADPNAKNTSNETPMMLAILGGTRSTRFIELLLLNGGNPLEVDNIGRTFFDFFQSSHDDTEEKIAQMKARILRAIKVRKDGSANEVML